MASIFEFLISIFLLSSQAIFIYCNSKLTKHEWNEPIKFGHIASSMIGVPKAEVGMLLTHTKSINNPEELGSYFGGDIIQPQKVGRNGLINEVYRWPNGVVPVEIRGDFDASNMAVINSAIEIYHNSTCIRLVQHSSENDYILITNTNTGCWSSVGRIGGAQVINLQTPYCLKTVGTTLHEIMHALGFNHEQSREDRDEHIQINWENIDSDHKYNFEKSEMDTTTDFDVEYDYSSILHYSPFAFAKNKTKPTIEPKQLSDESLSKVMGQRNGFAKSDLEKIWKMYKCTEITSNKTILITPPKLTPTNFLFVLKIVHEIFNDDEHIINTLDIEKQLN